MTVFCVSAFVLSARAVPASDSTTRGRPSSTLAPGCICRPPRLQHLFGCGTDPEWPPPIRLKTWLRKRSPKRLQRTSRGRAPMGAEPVSKQQPRQRKRAGGGTRLLQLSQLHLIHRHPSLRPNSQSYPEVSLFQLPHPPPVLSRLQCGLR